MLNSRLSEIRFETLCGRLQTDTATSSSVEREDGEKIKAFITIFLSRFLSFLNEFFKCLKH